MTANSDKSRINKQNISYYDAIADGYDDSLNRHDSNKVIRRQVAEKFQEIVKGGRVLDFGGGTGMDLQWLTNSGYQIYFCEPSSAMRDKAIFFNNNFLHNGQIVFLQGGITDFTQWKKQVPFERKVDAILADFAVINNISDLELLFESLSLTIVAGGHFIALILNGNASHGLLFRFMSKIKSFIFRKPASFDIRSGENSQTVFIYSINEIKIAASPYFEMASNESLHPAGFSLIHLVRK